MFLRHARILDQTDSLLSNSWSTSYHLPGYSWFLSPTIISSKLSAKETFGFSALALPVQRCLRFWDLAKPSLSGTFPSWTSGSFQDPALLSLCLRFLASWNLRPLGFLLCPSFFYWQAEEWPEPFNYLSVSSVENRLTEPHPKLLWSLSNFCQQMGKWEELQHMGKVPSWLRTGHMT